MVNLNEPSMRGLAVVLRDRKLWPKEYEWYQGDVKDSLSVLVWELWPDLKDWSELDEKYHGHSFRMVGDRIAAIEKNDVLPEQIAEIIEEEYR